MLEGMLLSARRAGLEFHDNIGLDETEEGFEVKVLLQAPIPKAVWPALKEYIETYALLADWRLRNVRHNARTLTFTASRA